MNIMHIHICPDEINQLLSLLPFWNTAIGWVQVRITGWRNR